MGELHAGWTWVAARIPDPGGADESAAEEQFSDVSTTAGDDADDGCESVVQTTEIWEVHSASDAQDTARGAERGVEDPRLTGVNGLTPDVWKVTDGPHLGTPERGQEFNRTNLSGRVWVWIPGEEN